ncbi:hypothetical protein CLOSYM_05015 [[Clostridium] symbiosum ATCC 14940]|uniref:Uncharacterized protein n=1 Tax=[Clostridium] symbiosum ATCC 14940 TaxID=411472 RepID=A0ABC9TP92_CLOSY|nr:hypothetical protein CLOSYM_05015 [[Clostridium] symbiosum ATCC 14940]
MIIYLLLYLYSFIFSFFIVNVLNFNFIYFISPCIGFVKIFSVYFDDYR